MSSPHEQYDLGIKAIIIRNRKLLMVRRADHDVWEVPGGRVDRDGTIGGTLAREIGEELPGARLLRVGQVLHAEQSTFRLPHNNRLLLLFFPVVVRLPRTIQLSSEHTDWRWVQLADLASLQVHATVRAIAEQVLD